MQDTMLPDSGDFPHRLKVSGPAQTLALGRDASRLVHGGEVILLHGPLGGGKTCFVQGFCDGLDVNDEVVSPTFTLVNTYQGRLRVHHLDFYRVDGTEDLTDIGVHDLLDEVWDGEAVVLVEWPLVLMPAIETVPDLVELLVLTGAEDQVRTWHLRGRPEAPGPWVELFDRKGEVPSC